MYEECCSHRVAELMFLMEELDLPLYYVKCSRGASWKFLWEEVNWILY